ncbi:MAG TPA: exopolysaccharide biosynthesis polyprenyl glycosylphosphotransferase [Cyclobacteriaceae bacterium]|nr:exopolysaccharide biosynthesis polyprenyl glycosylphosphotransferase [Cyclobacteriaceae bacterium]
MQGSLKAWLFAGDLLLLNLSILVCLNFYGGEMWIGRGINNIYLLVFSNLAWLFLVLVSTPYNITKGWAVSKVIRSQSAFIFIHLLIVASLVFFFRQQYTFWQIALMYLVFLPLFFAFRVFALYLRKVFTDERTSKNYVVIGRNNLAQDLRRFYLANPEYGYRFKGYLDFANDEISLERVSEFCAQNDIQEIFCCLPVQAEKQLQNIVAFGLNSLIKVRIVTNPPSATSQNIRFDSDQVPSLDQTIALDEGKSQVLKRMFDIVFSSVFVLLVMSWLVPLVGILIKLDSPGPVFFVQLRSGRGNKPFKCFKFRTMKVNAQSDTLQATKGDSRITKLGHFLRKTSIDEFPQFFNVLIGTMSVVGPRPHMLKHTDEYSQLIEHFMGRHYVKPGITGLSQCLGYRGETKDLVDMENRVRMDRYYIENWTFFFDIKIIFMTVVSLIRGSDKAF